MLRLKCALLTMLLVSAIALSQEAEQASGKNEQAEAESVAEDQLDHDQLADSNGDGIESPKTMSGMSILGNEEAPKSLVIIPWKSSELGADLSLSNTLDDRARPVDKEVFMRELRFYEIRAHQ